MWGVKFADGSNLHHFSLTYTQFLWGSDLHMISGRSVSKKVQCQESYSSLVNLPFQPAHTTCAAGRTWWSKRFRYSSDAGRGHHQYSKGYLLKKMYFLPLRDCDDILSDRGQSACRVICERSTLFSCAKNVAQNHLSAHKNDMQYSVRQSASSGKRFLWPAYIRR